MKMPQAVEQVQLYIDVSFFFIRNSISSVNGQFLLFIHFITIQVYASYWWLYKVVKK